MKKLQITSILLPVVFLSLSFSNCAGSRISNSDKMFEQKIDYIHFNPVKKGLVKEIEDWKYSSAADYYSDVKGFIDIEML